MPKVIELNSEECRLQAIDLLGGKSPFSKIMVSQFGKDGHIYAVLPDDYNVSEVQNINIKLSYGADYDSLSKFTFNFIINIISRHNYDMMVMQWENFNYTNHALKENEAKVISICGYATAAVVSRGLPYKRLLSVVTTDFNWFGSMIILVERLNGSSKYLPCEEFQSICKFVIIPAFDLDSYIIISTDNGRG